MTRERERDALEDVNGHAIDTDGKLLHDPRCYFCLNSTGQQLSYVKVEIERAAKAARP